jgi:hypothetical protein
MMIIPQGIFIHALLFGIACIRMVSIQLLHMRLSFPPLGNRPDDQCLDGPSR